MVELRVPGDKSIGHRWLMISAMAEGRSEFAGIPDSIDIEATRRVLRQLGATITGEPPGTVVVEGPARWGAASQPLDCANSGTTARFLIGLLAGCGQEGVVTGDDSLRRRPMDRVVYPLQAMGARIRYLEAHDRLPLLVEPRATGSLRVLRYRPRISSSQVRSALMLAAVLSRTELEVVDRWRSRDHTARLLKHLGAPVIMESTQDDHRVAFVPQGWDGRLRALSASLPGDLSSAAFLIVAGLLSGQSLRMPSLGLNPGRVGFLDVIRDMGADVRVIPGPSVAGEPVGTLEVRPAHLRPFGIGESQVPGLIDELPALAVLASQVQGVSEIKGAGELRYKESDRLRQLKLNLERLGVACEQSADGLRVRGGNQPLRGEVATGGDHRIAMAFGVLSGLSGSEVTVDDRDCVSISYPSFWSDLQRVTSGEKSL